MSTSDLHGGRRIALAASCVALNLVAGKVAALLSLPVYFDAVGTILAAALLPLAYAVAAGVVTSLLAWVVVFPTFIFFIGTQAAIALTAALAMRLGAFRRLWSSALAGLVIAAVAALVSTPVAVLVFGGVTLPSITAVNALLIASGQQLWTAVATGGFFIEAIDKTAAAIIAWLVLQRLPARLLAHAR
jgi:energy-coupling factor transport system substrate-specific component